MRTLGIILAGGTSTRLYPATLPVTKQLLPIYDKPLIYYPLSTLMLAGIRDIVVIVKPSELEAFKKVFEPTAQFGVDVEFLIQSEPKGIAQAIQIVKDNWKSLNDRFLFGNPIEFDRIALILGDNIFHGATLSELLHKANVSIGADFFVQRTSEPEKFGVIFERGHAIIEKPSANVISSWYPSKVYAVTGLYFYPIDVFDKIEDVKPSSRGELEITALNNMYLDADNLRKFRGIPAKTNLWTLARGVSWFDTGTASSMLAAAQYIKAIQDNQGLLVGSPHEVAFRNGWVSADWLEDFAIHTLKGKSEYATYLLRLIDEERL